MIPLLEDHSEWKFSLKCVKFAFLYYGGMRNPVIYYILSYTVILRFKEIIHTLYFIKRTNQCYFHFQKGLF